MLLRVICPHCGMGFLVSSEKLLSDDEILLLADDIHRIVPRDPEWEP